MRLAVLILTNPTPRYVCRVMYLSKYLVWLHNPDPQCLPFPIQGWYISSISYDTGPRTDLSLRTRFRFESTCPIIVHRTWLQVHERRSIWYYNCAYLPIYYRTSLVYRVGMTVLTRQGFSKDSQNIS